MPEIPSQQSEFDPTQWQIFDPLNRETYTETDLNKEKIASRSIRDFLDDVAGPEGSEWIHDQSDYASENEFNETSVEINNELRLEAHSTAHLDDEIQRKLGAQELRPLSEKLALHDGTKILGKLHYQSFDGNRGVIRVSPEGLQKVVDLLGGGENDSSIS